MKNRITDLFLKKPAGILSVFFTAGYPALDDTAKIGRWLEAAGADLIEVGIPFSDPIADGPVIQESNKIALGNGMTVAKLLQQIREMRKTVKLPVILMGYLNPVMQYGIEKFCREAADAGVDGLILPDLPMDEYENELKKIFDENNLTCTFLISPTTSEERIRRVDKATTGFVYAVSASSTTGARRDFTSEQEQYFSKVQNLKLQNRVLIGFGISSHETFARACEFGSGAIVGSAFISMLGKSTDLENDIGLFVGKIRGN